MKKIRIFIRIRAFSLAVLFLFSVMSSSVAHAGAWGEETALLQVEQVIKYVQGQIEGILLSVLKSTAITLLNTRVMGLVGGTSTGTSQVISDWKDYLYQEPEDRVRLAMDNYYATTLRGRSTGFSSGSGSSYEAYLQRSAETHLATKNSVSDSISRLGELTSDPAEALSRGDIRVFTAMYSSGSDPFGYSLRAEEYQMAVREQYRKEAELQAVAYAGYKGVRDNDGNVILPGSTVGQMVADVQDVGNKVIAAAQNPVELIGGVVTSLANRMITNMVRNGVGTIQSSINREIRNVDNQVMGSVTTVNRTLGTGAAYTTEIRQRTDMNLGAASVGAVPPIVDGN